jgi:SAM-dependent methyltransferase
MLLKELLEIDEEIYLVEESYLSQYTLKLTRSYLSEVLDSLGSLNARFLRVKEGNSTLGLLLFNSRDENVPVDFWSVFTGAFAASSLKAEFESSVDSILARNPAEREIEVSAELWRDALNEYYSLMLINRNLCSVCNARPESYENIFSENRVQRVTEILERLKEKGYSFEGKVLEICAGNGMSTLALYRFGLDPFAVEVNKCMVCQGLEQGVLNPRKALVMDARTLSKYFGQGSFDVVLGFMLGLVYEFNSELWTGIMREAAAVAKRGGLLLFTVSSKPEIEILAGTLRRAGIEGEIVDNTDTEGIYDQWYFIGKKK